MHLPSIPHFKACFVCLIAAAAASACLAQTSVKASSAPVSAPADGKPTDPSAAYRLDRGPMPTASVDLNLPTSAPDRKLPVKVRYPKGASTSRPVVIFSHGAGGDGNGFADLTDHWASWGYVVLLPTHSDSLRLRREAGQDTRAFDARDVVSAVRPVERLADVELLLDSLGQIEKQCPGLRGADGKGGMDRGRMAIAGHSAGAMIAQIAIGVKARTPRNLRPADIGDKRFKAAIVISGPGSTNRVFTDQSWAELDKPMLTVTGSLDSTTVTGETPKTRQEPFALAKPGDKYLLFIEGATHASYAGKAAAMFLGERPTGDMDMITGATAIATLAFLDAYLMDDPQARKYLVSDGISRFSRNQATLKAR